MLNFFKYGSELQDLEKLMIHKMNLFQNDTELIRVLELDLKPESNS